MKNFVYFSLFKNKDLWTLPQYLMSINQSPTITYTVIQDRLKNTLTPSSKYDALNHPANNNI